MTFLLTDKLLVSTHGLFCFIMLTVFSHRSSCWEVFCKKGVLGNFTNTQEKTCVRVFLIKLKKESQLQVFSCEPCNIFKNTFFIEHLRWLLLIQGGYIHTLTTSQAIFSQPNHVNSFNIVIHICFVDKSYAVNIRQNTIKNQATYIMRSGLSSDLGCVLPAYFILQSSNITISIKICNKIITTTPF